MILGVENVVGPTTYYTPSVIEFVMMVIAGVFFLIGAFAFTYRSRFSSISGFLIGAAIGIAVILPLSCYQMSDNFFGVGTAESVSYADGVSTVHVVNTKTGMDETVSIQDDLRSLEGTEVVASNLGKGDNNRFVKSFDEKNPGKLPADVRFKVMYDPFSVLLAVISVGFAAYMIFGDYLSDGEKREIADARAKKQAKKEEKAKTEASVTDERAEFDKALRALSSYHLTSSPTRWIKPRERGMLESSMSEDIHKIVDILVRRSSELSRTELVNYGDKMSKIVFLLGDDYYRDLFSNPEWDDPYEKAREVRDVIHEFANSLRAREKSRTTTLSVNADAIIDSIRSGL